MPEPKKRPCGCTRDCTCLEPKEKGPAARVKSGQQDFPYSRYVPAPSQYPYGSRLKRGFSMMDPDNQDC